MHVHSKKPDCYTDECCERGVVWLDRGRDCGRDCGNFHDADSERRNLTNTPTCCRIWRGCVPCSTRAA